MHWLVPKAFPCSLWKQYSAFHTVDTEAPSSHWAVSVITQTVWSLTPGQLPVPCIVPRFRNSGSCDRMLSSLCICWKHHTFCHWLFKNWPVYHKLISICSFSPLHQNSWPYKDMSQVNRFFSKANQKSQLFHFFFLTSFIRHHFACFLKN